MNCQEVKRENLCSHYLLGELSDSQRREFEQHYFECRQCFEQVEEKEDQLLTRYALGDIGEEEKPKFEQYFLLGKARQEQLATKRSVLEQIRNACSDVSKESSLGETGTDIGFGTARFHRLWPAAAVALILLSTSTAYLWVQDLQSRGQLRTARSRIEELEGFLRKQQQVSGALRQEKDLGIAVADADVNTPFVQLTPTIRGGDSPTKTIALPPKKLLVIFYLEFESAMPSREYILSLRNQEGKTIWESENVSPRDESSFIVTLPTSRVGQGARAFQLSIEQRGQRTVLANYPFRIKAP